MMFKAMESTAAIVAIGSAMALGWYVPRWGIGNPVVVFWGLFAVVCAVAAVFLVWAERFKER